MSSGDKNCVLSWPAASYYGLVLSSSLSGLSSSPENSVSSGNHGASRTVSEELELRKPRGAQAQRALRLRLRELSRNRRLARTSSLYDRETRPRAAPGVQVPSSRCLTSQGLTGLSVDVLSELFVALWALTYSPFRGV